MAFRTGSKRISQLNTLVGLDGGELLELATLSTTVVLTSTNISAKASDRSFNNPDGLFIASGFSIGKSVNISGFTGGASANDIYSAVVTAVTDKKLIIGGADGAVIVDAAAGESVTITLWETYKTTAAVVANLGIPPPIISEGQNLLTGATEFLTAANFNFTSQARLYFNGLRQSSFVATPPRTITFDALETDTDVLVDIVLGDDITEVQDRPAGATTFTTSAVFDALASFQLYFNGVRQSTFGFTPPTTINFDALETDTEVLVDITRG